MQFGSDQPEAVSAAELPVAGPQDTLSATFALCGGGNRSDCVVDGDTFWLAGEKYRVLDINTPETSTPRCDREYELGQAATRRFIELLNAGPFRLESGAEETDRYGRKLRRVMRGQQSLGDVLVAEGLAENWQGFRRDWC
ncbi:nuclease [Croceicoccus naphthovorans]|uniref:Nuclease n=1 Tax=Croceicoccus naphthovorans TaxID=1348774 RepID=A0A0G3XM35_9SPHN|nr:nuclease [Croceicoccus naphthovorans]